MDQIRVLGAGAGGFAVGLGTGYLLNFAYEYLGPKIIETTDPVEDDPKDDDEDSDKSSKDGATIRERNWWRFILLSGLNIAGFVFAEAVLPNDYVSPMFWSFFGMGIQLPLIRELIDLYEKL